MGKKPTELQKRALDNVVSGKFKTRKAALLDAGYSKTVAEHPHQVLESEGAKAYIEGFDQKAQARYKMSIKSKLQDVFLDGLEATKLVGSDAIVHPDYQVRLAYAEKIAEMFSLLESRRRGGPMQFNFFMFDPDQRQELNTMFNAFVRQQVL